MKTTKSKAYSSASNAKRAAKAAGQPEALISADAHGYYFETPVSAKAPAAKKTAKPATKESTDYEVSRGLTAEQKAELAKLEEEAIERGDITSKPTEFEKGAGDFPTLIVRKSVVKHPVEQAWDLFDTLRADADKSGQKLRRKDAIAAAVKGGIAFYTARTQYQSWKTANKF